MFEKSLYDLIKGLRNHKGSEDDYIQSCLRECKAEIKSQDTDKKATALLKLIYLEMFGYDMSWASFHVLEVMSSPKYLQKRVGYLGAVQSFRPDTEVLMLATNMLKKDIVSPNIPALSLPLATLPHIITPSLAMSLLPDIVSRLSHSSAVVRKKTLVCLYRLALVYPEALKSAWPKIKDHLMDDQEDSSVTTASINVICELGWRRPHDFLPMAPRFFELLVDSGNNWMAIKIIKLFATLTPLEPRLTRKLLRPLTNIIQTTTAMSLLYECINGIIQGGILDSEENSQERDEVAALCVGKLRGMIVMDSDPNLKYVALLALNRIVTTHPLLVSMQQDVIMDCLDDPDVSIRLQALELTAGMITSDTLQVVVNRLVNQLQMASSQNILEPEETLLSHVDEESRQTETPHATTNSLNMPSDYRSEVIHRILDVCSQNNYSELVDFVWYIEVLVQLVKLLPPSDVDENWHQSAMRDQENPNGSKTTVASRIGTELRNIAVRVKGVRLEATRAAESLLLVDNKSTLFPATSNVGIGVLGPAAWISGEYAGYLQSPGRTLQSLIDPFTISLPPSTLQLFLQAIPKVLVRMDRSHQTQEAWRSEISLLLVRVIAFLETIAAHPDLDVQERAIEFLEVLRLGAESLHSDPQEMPALLASVIPNLFTGLDLNPVATSAQGRVVLPPDLRLNEAFLGNLPDFFQGMNEPVADTAQHHSIQKFYYDSYHASSSSGPPQLHAQLSSVTLQPDASYQNNIGGATEFTSAIDKRKMDKKERYRDDPFYIAPIGASSSMSSPRRGVPSPNSDSLDIDSIPIVDLKLAGENLNRPGLDAQDIRSTQSTSRMEVTADETFGQEGPMPSKHLLGTAKSTTFKQSLLQVDSSGLEDLNLEAKSDAEPTLPPGGDDVEMKQAMQNVEQMRLRMQRASERIQLEGIPAEGTLIKKKKKGKRSDDNTKSVRRKKKVKEEKISVLE